MKLITDYFKSLKFDDILKFTIVGMLYYISGKLGLRLALENPSATAIWAPTGIAIASYLMFGYRVFPAILLGAFFTNVTTAGTIISSLGIAAGNTLEGLLAMYLVNKYAEGKNAFYRVGTVFNFALLAGFASTVVSATIGTTTLLLSGLTNISSYGSVWTTWWLGDAGGALIFTPLIILWAAARPYTWKITRIIELFVVLVILIVISEFIFANNLHLTYLLIPVLLWAAIRLGPREAITGVCFVAVVGIIATLRGSGPFYADGGSLPQALILLQLYMGTLSVMTLTIASLVHERERDRQELENREKRFKALVEKSADAISLLDPKGTTLYTGPSTEHLLGYTPEELNGTDAFSLVHPDDLPRTYDVFKKLLVNPGGSESAEFRLKKKDGSWSWMEATGTNLLNNPAVAAIVVNYRDITERKNIEETVEQEKAEDEALLESIGEGIIATDNAGKIILVNQACQDLLQYNEDELVNMTVSSVLGMEDENGQVIAEEERPINIALEKRKKVTATHILVRKNGSKFPAVIVASPVVLQGKIIGAIKVFRDITQEKEIDRAKTEFVSLASHQLRTPLTTINWYIEMLMNKNLGPLNEKQQDYLSEVYTASRRMVALTNALLTISRLDLGKISFSLEDVNIKNSIDLALQDLEVQIKAKGLQIKVEYLPENGVANIKSDSKFIYIILQNILSNSVKYSNPQGIINVKISKDDEKKNIIVAIKDRGYGIPTSEQSKVFTKLFRASNVADLDQRGTGLGLYMVKSLIERMGGKIKFESPPKGENEGTVFYLTIPISQNVNEKKT